LSRRFSITMSEDILKKFMQQVQRAGQSSSGRGFSGGPRGFFTGSGLLIALVGGGFLLNASLFNGRWFVFLNPGCC
jgi:prohibitin 2